MQITALSFCIGYLGDFIKVKQLIKLVKINPQSLAGDQRDF
jgi:hypothetical protein